MIKVGISECLLGKPVRYDGGHKQNRFCKNDLAQFFELTPLCPEVGIGLPVPRKTIRLVGDIGNPRAVLSDDGNEDFTEALSSYADEKRDLLSSISGYVFCKGSPSCGVERVKVYNDKGMAERKGTGIFAQRVKTLFPLMPIEEDGRLNDPLLRDSFIKRVYAFEQWKQLIVDDFGVKAFQDFHARHKFMLLAHSQPIYRKLGPLVASARKDNLEAVAAEYIALFMEALKKASTRKNNVNVLMHLQGYLKEQLDSDDRQELAQVIKEYGEGIQPILAPLTLLKHHFKHYPDPYIAQQSYLEPYPKELAIRVSMQ